MYAVCVCACVSVYGCVCVCATTPVGQDFAFLAHDLCSRAKQCEANAQRFLKWVKHVACGTNWMRNIPIPPLTNRLPLPPQSLPTRLVKSRTRAASSAAFRRISSYISCGSVLGLIPAGVELRLDLDRALVWVSGSLVGLLLLFFLPNQIYISCTTRNSPFCDLLGVSLAAECERVKER